MASWCCQCLLSCPSFLCRDHTSLPCVGFFVGHRKVCSNLIYQCSAYFCLGLKIPVATSKPLFSLKYVATLIFCCNQASSLSQHHFSRLCFSIRTRNLVFQCRDIHYLVATELLHTVSRHRLPCRDRDLSSAYSFCLNRLFQVAIISVVTKEDSVVT